jgi:hypothetical protein
MVMLSHLLKLSLKYRLRSQNLGIEDMQLNVVRRYLNPHEHALVHSCEEKSTIQAPKLEKPNVPGARPTLPEIGREMFDG